MIPIGGRIAKNTMNEDEALEARVERMAIECKLMSYGNELVL